MSTATKKMTMVAALNLALTEAMDLDPSVLLLGEDVADPQGGGVMKVTEGLSTRFGSRVRSTPIAEQAIVGAAVGAAVAGMRPIAEIMLMNFVTVAMDQITNHAAKLRFMSGGQTGVPLTIRMISGTGWSLGGQHSDLLEAWFCHTPGLKVVMPSTPAEARGLLLSSIFDDDPVIFVEPLPLYYIAGEVPVASGRIPLGKAEVAREGSDVTIVSYGRAVPDVLAIAAEMADEGISVEVVNLRTVSPIDYETVFRSVSKTKTAVVVHEAVKRHGVGAEISSRIHEELFSDLRAPVARIGATFSPVPFSKPLEEAYAFDKAEIRQAVRRLGG